MISRRCALLSGLALACTRKGSRPDSGVMRIVSLSPSTTETVAAIGALSLLVGRSRYCDYPPEVRPLPEVGGYTDSNLEAIVGLSPTLVVGARGPAGSAIVDKLSVRGIDTYFPETESLAQIDEMILGLGARTGHSDDAHRVTADLRAKRSAIAAATLSLPRARVVLLFGIQPIVAAGKKTFADDMLAGVGADNAAVGSGYPALDIEALVALDPDVILNAAAREGHGGESVPRDALGWRSLRAVKTNRVIDITDEAVLRPGPRVGDGLATLARAIHPGVVI